MTTDNASQGADVAPRLQQFLTYVRNRGGPAGELDFRVEGLEPLWRWFVRAHRAPRRQEGQPAFEAGGLLPDWYPQRMRAALQLGRGLSLSADGLAAYATEVIIRREPQAVWTAGKDPWLAGPVRLLKLPERRPFPPDIVFVDLVWSALKENEPLAREPEALQDLVGRCLAVGDPRARLYEALSVKEATELLRLVEREHPARVARFIEALRQDRGPADRLDYSLESLVPAWRWLVKRHRLPKRVATDRELRSRDPPWWYDFWPWYAQLLGPDLATLATGVADYAAACIRQAVPGTEWGLGADRLGDFREPILRVGGRMPFSVHEVVVRLASDGVSKSEHARKPEALRAMVERSVTAAREPTVDQSQVSEPYRVIVIRNEPFDYQIALADEVAHEEEERVESFIANLRSDARVDRVIHEDREVILINSSLSEQAFRAAADAAWRRAALPRADVNAQ